MSSLYLAFGVVATFASVVAAALTLRVSAQSRRPVEVLETELRHAGVSIRQHTLQRPFVERVMDPLVSALARMAGHLAPAGARDRIAMKLVLAGSPPSWTPERVLGLLRRGGGRAEHPGDLLDTSVGLHPLHDPWGRLGTSRHAPPGSHPPGAPRHDGPAYHQR